MKHGVAFALCCMLVLGASCKQIEHHEPACEKAGQERACFCDDNRMGTKQCNGPNDEELCDCDGSPPSEGIVQLETSGDHSCALLGDGRVLCWGRNDHGQLGVGDTLNRNMPLLVDDLKHISALALAGGTPYGFSCVLSEDGDVQCFGRNRDGELGDGTNTERRVPTKLDLHDVVLLRSDTLHSCALTVEGQVWCWGLDANGQIGVPPSSGASVLEPTRVPKLKAMRTLDVGWQHTCVVDADGEPSCFGYNNAGQLGDAKAPSGMTLRSVAGVHGVTQIAAGLQHTCALTEDDEVWCWGHNKRGQLGDGTTKPRTAAVRVEGLEGASKIVQLVVGHDHGCVLDEDGELRCWGDNAHGQLGDGTTTRRPSAIRVHDLDAVGSISAGGQNTCALLRSGVPMCFGLNSAGQIGDGTRVERRVPTRVRFVGVETSTSR